MEMEGEDAKPKEGRSGHDQGVNETEGGTSTYMKLSMNSMSGFRSNHTMKMRGRLNEETIVVLIDSGATHNFLSVELLRRVIVEIEEVAEHSITVGDGHSIWRQHCCRDMKLSVQELEVNQTFYPFPLKGDDVVLGVEWLKSLGEVKVDWG